MVTSANLVNYSTNSHDEPWYTLRVIHTSGKTNI